MRAITVRLPDELYEKLKQRAEHLGIAPAVLGRSYIKGAVEQGTDPARVWSEATRGISDERVSLSDQRVSLSDMMADPPKPRPEVQEILPSKQSRRSSKRRNKGKRGR